MEPSVPVKRRKTDQENDAPKQVDAHIRAFLKAVISNAQNSRRQTDSSTCNGAAILTVSSPSRRSRAPHHDASTQTDEDEFIEFPTPLHEPRQSPTAVLSQNAAAYYAAAAAASAASGPSNTDLQYFSADSSSSSSKMSSGDVRQLVSDWMQQYENWFFQNFGVDVRSVSATPMPAPEPSSTPPSCLQSFFPLPPNPPLPDRPSPPTFMPHLNTPSPALPTSIEDVTVGCQTPFQISQAPVMYSAVVPTVNPALFIPVDAALTALISQQMAAQNFLSSFILSRQQQQMAVAMVTAMAAQQSSGRVVPPPPAPPNLDSLNTTPATAVSDIVDTDIDPNLSDSMELSGPVSQYGAYGILKPCAFALENKSGDGDKADRETVKSGDNDNIVGEDLPIYITPEEYRNKPRSWMPPPPPTVLLLRKQAMVCVMQAHIRNKAHEISVRKSTASRGPVEIDYVAALEVTVEKCVKVKVTYVFNRINRLPYAAQTPFLCGVKHAELHPTRPKSATATFKSEDGTFPNSVGTAETDTTDGTACEMIEQPMISEIKKAEDDGELVVVSKEEIADAEEVDDCEDEDELEVKINPVCDEHSRAMYICDLLIGDVFICQGLAGNKLQAKSCAARKAFSVLSRSNFLVGGVRKWYRDIEDVEPIDYLTLCLSPKADQVPLLNPFLADPLKPIPSDQPINPDDPAETFRVCNPKSIDELWLYTALPISVNPETALTPEQYLAQSAEFSQTCVDFEVEFNSTTGVFTCHGLVDGHRYGLRARAVNVIIARAQAAFKLLRRLKETQPVVGLLLPPPDPDDGDEESVPSLPEDDSMHPLWGLTEASIVDSLMWGRQEKQFALPIEHLEAHCEIPDLRSTTNSAKAVDVDFGTMSFFSSREHLELYIQAYAASAVVTPLRISLTALPHSLWSLARTSAHAWGLLTRIEFDSPENLQTAFLLVCKRAPLPRLKRTLYERTEVGVFYLLARGRLPGPVLKDLCAAELLDLPEESDGRKSPTHPVDSPPASPSPLDPFDAEDDPLTRLARTFHASAVKAETATDETAVNDGEAADLLLVSAELNQPSNAVEILDDLPRQLIPGIDF